MSTLCGGIQLHATLCAHLQRYRQQTLRAQSDSSRAFVNRVQDMLSTRWDCGRQHLASPEAHDHHSSYNPRHGYYGCSRLQRVVMFIRECRREMIVSGFGAAFQSLSDDANHISPLWLVRLLTGGQILPCNDDNSVCRYAPDWYVTRAPQCRR